MYINWRVGDIVSIGVKIEDFKPSAGCSYGSYIYLGSYDMQLSPTPLNIPCILPGCAYQCIDTRNREVVFYSCMNQHYILNDVYCGNKSYDYYYRELFRTTTDSNGRALHNYTVSSQDLLDYNDALSKGGKYNIVACINDSLATSAHAINFGNITIAQNLCLNKPSCPNICIANNLYSQVCDPNTGNCTQGTLIQTNSPICTATDRIDYDFSALPTTFLNLISSNILSISDTLGPLLPTASNIQYMGSDYLNGKFRIFVRYTAPAGISKLTDLDITIIEKLQLVQTLAAYAALIASVLIFILAGIIGTRFGWQAGVITGVIGIIVAAWSITHLPTGSPSNYTSGEPSPDQKVKTVKDYVNTYLKPACASLYPTCAADPPTCDAGTMRAYNGCIGGNSIAQCRQAAAVSGDPPTTCDPTFNEVQAIDTCLASTPPSCTVQDAKNRIKTVENNTETYVNNTINKVTCSPGLVYDPTTQKCLEECAIPGPLGSCLLTQAALKEVAIVGGLLIGGYVVFKILTRPKPQRITISTAPTRETAPLGG